MTTVKKVAIASLVGGGTSTIATAANYLSDQSIDIDPEDVEQLEISSPVTLPVVAPTPVSKPTPSFSSKIESKWLEGGAIPSIMDSKEVKSFDDLTISYEDGGWFGDHEKDDHKYIRSSLRVSTEKWTYANMKWKGAFTWVWSFANERINRGFATYNKAETTANKGLKLTGVFYLLKKVNGQWEIEYQMEVKDSDRRMMYKDNLYQYFPKPYWYTQEGKFDEVYWTNWNFMNSAIDLDNACAFADKYSHCGTSPVSPYTWTEKYEWVGEGWYEDYCDYLHYGKWCDTVYGWSGNAKDESNLQWYDFMYRQDERNYRRHNLLYWLESFYRGRWTKV